MGHYLLRPAVDIYSVICANVGHLKLTELVSLVIRTWEKSEPPQGFRFIVATSPNSPTSVRRVAGSRSTK